ncbi:T6SS immunity protein Tdi1 domain-containing protein [Moritella yayanosii]|uniref:T6SS immunity protein Tdi1 C-terminal domain-containing protein n=1 Tax=Moritella yayanosii TaxID=69539 RepID=A0A330LIU8_9GAMM|nr:T6SS immunity protein Tdi1 domain-containing protein [Moritella yayanosii]SQD76790.1 protein of unknown function [Moritella yayanosii]
MVDKSILPEFDGESAYSGALRFYDDSCSDWEYEWGKLYGSMKPTFKLFAIDAFGTAYGLLSDENVAIFWSETGELEPIDANLEEFLGMILEDPYTTINYDLYISAVEHLGKPSFHEHFAFKVELALGGSLSVDNLTIMDSTKHFHSLAKIAFQINEIKVGSSIRLITRE